MKTTILKSTFLAVITAGFLTSCVEDNEYATPQLECTETALVKNIEVKDVLFPQTVTKYNQDDVIEAYVTSSDKGGNFFKSISFISTDGTKAFSVPVDITSTFTNFEPGRKVLIKLKDTYLDNPATGPIGRRIGALFVNSSGEGSVGRLSAEQYSKVLNRSCTVVNEDIFVKKFSSIAQIKNDQYLNMLIELNEVQFSKSAVSRTYYDSSNDLGGATNYKLYDKEGNTIIFRTSSFANYAKKTVPSGSGKIKGILTKFGSDYQFVVRTEDDIKLSTPRFYLNEEEFTEAIGWTNFSVTGTEMWALNTSEGNPGSCYIMNGFSGGSARTNEDWLISPSLDLTGFTKVGFAFQNSSRFAGAPLKVYISENYIGSGNPNLATWVEATGLNLDLNTATYIWTDSGYTSLNSYKDKTNIYVAFKYTSVNTNNGAATWRVDNFVLVGDK